MANGKFIAAFPFPVLEFLTDPILITVSLFQRRTAITRNVDGSFIPLSLLIGVYYFRLTSLLHFPRPSCSPPFRVHHRRL